MERAVMIDTTPVAGVSAAPGGPARSARQKRPPARRASQRIGGAAKLPVLLRGFQVDPDEIFAAAGLSPRTCDDPDSRIAFDDLGRLLEACAARTQCDHFALLAGRLWRLADWGPVGELVRDCATVGAALHAFNAHQHLMSEGAMTLLRNHGDTVDFVFAVYVPVASGGDMLHDAAAAAAFNLLADLCGPQWAPLEVCLPHARPHDVAPYRGLFRAPLRFDADVCAVRFAARWLEHPVAGADPGRKHAVEHALAVRDRPSTVQRVYRALRSSLLAGHKGGNHVAGSLSMHRRTLSRRLDEEGTTYQAAIDDVRLAVATHQLRDTRITLDDIAANLGYASVNTFIRAFARWTGVSPGHWRRERLQYRRGSAPRHGAPDQRS
jgi:AraC-like DNA-binding protein